MSTAARTAEQSSSCGRSPEPCGSPRAQLAELYDTSVPNIAQIIRRVLDDGEVTEATINSELKVQIEAAHTVRREVKIYNFDMVLAVGYR